MTNQVFLLTNDSELVEFENATSLQLELDAGISGRVVLDKKGRLIDFVTPSDLLEFMEKRNIPDRAIQNLL